MIEDLDSLISSLDVELETMWQKALPQDNGGISPPIGGDAALRITIEGHPFQSGDGNEKSGWNKVVLPPLILSKYKALKGLPIHRLDRDDTKWMDCIDRICSITYQTCANLSAMGDKELYTYLIENAERDFLDTEFFQDIVSSLMEYVQTGITKPMLFYGAPGIGKTETAIKIASILGMKYYLTSASVSEHRHGMLGESSAYKSPDYGEMIRAIVWTETLNPMIIIDEIDKTIGSNQHLSVSDELLTVLNNSEMEVHDNLIGFPISMKHSLIIMTCNDIERVSSPLRDRCMVYQLPTVEERRMSNIVEDYAKTVIHERYHNKIILPERAFSVGIKTLLNHTVGSIRQHKLMVDNVLKQTYRNYITSDAELSIVTESIIYDQCEKLIPKHTRMIGF